MNSEYPILEFDSNREAIIEPTKILKPVPSHVINIGTCMGPISVYRMTHEGRDIAVAHPGLGAPFAAGVLEELIAFGCRKFIACGFASALNRTLVLGTVVVPSAAVRDEGTSYHYVSPNRDIVVDPEVVRIIQSVLDFHGVKYQIGKTWTTDAIYRETKDRIAKRKSEGCLTVEMECAAFLAVAAFRNMRFGQLLATGDDYGKAEFQKNENWEQELGDLLFSLICVANATGVDLEEALLKVMTKYQKRIEDKQDPGLGK